MSVPWRPAGQATSLTGFAVSLDAFEGPLELLLHLIEKQGLDITGVSVLAVTDQFIAYARQLGERFADAASEFLLVGSQLALLKSRALLPQAEADEEEETAEDLAARLRLYAAFKAVAGDLDQRLDTGLASFIRVAAPLVARPPVEPGSGDLAALIRSLDDMLAKQRTPEPAVAPPILRYAVADKIRDLAERVRRERTITFERLASECADRAELIVTFIALLHLVQARRLTVEQAEPFGPITLRGVAAHE